MNKIRVGAPRNSSLLPLTTCVRFFRAPHRSRGLPKIRAESGGLGDFFKRDDSKQVCIRRNTLQIHNTICRFDHLITTTFTLQQQDAARKALQDAFKGAKDPFAAEEKRRKERGGGGGGGDGGSGGGFGGFDFNDFGENFKKWLSSTMRAIAAAILFIGAISLFYLWQPLLTLLTKIVRVVLRLDGNPRAQMAAGPAATPDFTRTEGLGNVESSIISKYGGDADMGADEDEDDDEESDEE